MDVRVYGESCIAWNYKARMALMASMLRWFDGPCVMRLTSHKGRRGVKGSVVNRILPPFHHLVSGSDLWKSF